MAGINHYMVKVINSGNFYADKIMHSINTNPLVTKEDVVLFFEEISVLNGKEKITVINIGESFVQFSINPSGAKIHGSEYKFVFPFNVNRNREVLRHIAVIINVIFYVRGAKLYRLIPSKAQWYRRTVENTNYLHSLTRSKNNKKQKREILIAKNNGTAQKKYEKLANLILEHNAIIKDIYEGNKSHEKPKTY